MKVWGVVGWKNSGKTGLVERLVTEFTGRGLRVSTVKHAHLAFDLDQAGTDSERHRQAGAREVVLSSANRWAILHELGDEPEADLDALLNRMSPVDLVIVEGFKGSPHKKIEALRDNLTEAPVASWDKSICAFSGRAQPDGLDLPLFAPEDIAGTADFIWRMLEG